MFEIANLQLGSAGMEIGNDAAQPPARGLAPST